MRALPGHRHILLPLSRTFVASGTTVYGINTGFGALAQTAIPAGQLAELQRRLVLSHSVGVGALLPDPVVRLIITLKIVGLARGHSGVRPAVIQALLGLLAPASCRAFPPRARSARRAIWRRSPI